MRKLRVIDMFAGIGGFTLGLHRAGGYETVKFCEMKPHARAVLAKNFPGIPCHDDVTTYDFKEGEADVITAGFPCQDISFAGAGAGLAGSRSGLYREVIRAIRVVRPLYAILENVAALLGRGMGVVLGDLAEIGHDAEWHCIPASAIRANHRRDRIWIITNPNCQQGRARAGGQNGSKGVPQLADAERIRQSGQGQPVESSRQTPLINRETVDAFAGRVGHIWATEPDVGRVAHGVPHRMDRLSELGNAVVPQIPELIGRAILQSRKDAA